MAAILDTPTPTPLTAADGTPLRTRLRLTERRNRLKALLLVVPLLLFILISFIIPIADMLFRSVDNPVVAGLIPETVAALEDWDGNELPSEAVFAVMVEELKQLSKDKTAGKLGSRLNFEKAGMRSLMTKSARRIKRVTEGPYQDALLKIDKKWGDIDTWATIKRIGQRYTSVHYLAAVDKRYDNTGNVISQPENRQICHAIHAHTVD